MKRYQIYGLGNALVDMEYEVTPETLAELKTEKGVMTLVDEAHQQEMLEKLREKSVKRGSGGSAANSVIAVAQFGGRAFYSCKVADDEAGDFYIQDLNRSGVDTNLNLDQRERGVTGKCLVFVTPDADRTMNTFLGITADISRNELELDALKNSDYLYAEGYLVTSQNGRDAVTYAREVAASSGVKTALSLSDPNIVKFFREGLMEMIGDGVDLLFANESEALGMAQTEDLETALSYLERLATRFVVTRGPDGALVFDGQQRIAVEGHPVKAVDTVGAGDMFAGAFLYGITHGMEETQAARLASFASSRLVTSFGPRLSMEQTQQILRDFQGAV